MNFFDFKPPKLPFTYGGYEFYEAEGRVRFRLSFKRPSREDLLYGEAFEGVRKSNSEFAYIAEVNKHFRVALAPLFRISIPYFHSYIQRLFVKLNQFDLKHDLGEKRLVEALHHPEFYNVLADFNYCPNVGQWATFFQAGLEFKASESCLKFDPSAIHFDLFDHFLRFDMVIGELIFDFDTFSFDTDFQLQKIEMHTTEVFEYHARLPQPTKPRLHFLVYSVFAVPEYDFSRKRSKQIEPLLYLNLIHLP